MNRRSFIRSLLAGGAALLGGGKSKYANSLEESGPMSPHLKQREARGRLNRTSAQRTLSEHRLVKIEARRLRDRYPRLVGRNAKGRPAGRGGSYQVRILTTDKGASGWGMSASPEEKVHRFVGARLGDLFGLEKGPVEEAFVFQIPLYDLVGNILGLPVYELLGARGPRAIPIYSGAIYFDDLEPQNKPRGVAGVLVSCQQDYDVGYRAFKLKIGRGFKWMPRGEGLKRDIEVTHAVRERFPDCKTLVDANDAYTVEDFSNYVQAVAECELYCIEEPFRESRDDLLRLRQDMNKAGCKALIMDGEARTEAAKPPWRFGGYTRAHVERLFALATEKLVDIFNMDLGIVGFARWTQVMPELVRAGVLASPHTWAWTPRPYYVAQLGSGVGNVVIIEGIPGSAGGVDYSAYQFADGKLVVPPAPGFGLSLTQ